MKKRKKSRKLSAMSCQILFWACLVVLTVLACLIILSYTYKPEHTHSLQHVDGVSSTCTESGMQEYWYCSECGKYFTNGNATDEIALTDLITEPAHSWDDGTVTTAATCTKNGIITYTCTVCSETKTEVSEAFGHSWDDGTVIEAATCTSMGVSEYHCTACSETKVEATAALGHDFTADSAVWSWADDNSSASVVLTCSHDNTHTETIAAELTSATTAATCTEEGKTEIEAAVSLNEVEYTDKKTVAIPAKGHDYENETDITLDNYKVCKTCSHEACSEGLVYTFNSGATSYILTGLGTCTDTEVIIPSTYNGLPVEKINAGAFLGSANLKNVIIRDGITEIGIRAFEECTSLENIILPDSLESIGNNAFIYCSSLKSVNIPEGVTRIDARTFSDCCSLTSVTIPDGLTYLGTYAFYKCTSLTSVTIPDGVTAIYADTFYNCKALNSVIISENATITTIYDYAFYQCYSLTSITIPSTVTTISGSNAFYYCYNLVEVYNLSDLSIKTNNVGLGQIGRYAKIIHTSLDEPSIVETDADGYQFFEDSGAYYLIGYTGSETDLTLPASCKTDSYSSDNYSIYNYAFYYNQKITNVTISAGVTSIGQYAFSYCEWLKSVVIEDGDNSITLVAETFAYCFSLWKIVIPKNVTTINKNAIYISYAIKNVYYKGNADEWSTTYSSSTSTADSLNSANIYYYDEKHTATETGNYWNYDEDGNIVEWSVE